jgi:uncharacterized protein YcbK (DUF882 family)
MHFKEYEFDCKCGCGFNIIKPEVLELCEVVRDLNGGTPLIPNSGCRCLAHNAAVGGAPKSQHLLGKAADLPVNNPRAIAEMLDELFPNTCGIGIYDEFIHVDIRENRARW